MLRSQAGLTLVELLVAMTLMLIVLGATFTSFDTFYSNQSKSTKMNEQQQVLRQAMNQLVRQIRNLASPTSTTNTIKYADSWKLIFQTTDPNKQWVSYCLDTGGTGTAGGTTSNAILWYQVSSGASVPGSTGCPASGTWAKQVRVSENLTNRIGTDRPLFAYSNEAGSLDVSSAPLTPTSSPDSSAHITRVTMDMFLDLQPTKPPAELELTSGAYMRNQNQSPVARFTAFSAGGQRLTFDGSDSSDPEDRNLLYSWYEEWGSGTNTPTTSDLTAINTAPPDCTAVTIPPPTTLGTKTWNCLGTGVILTHDFSVKATGEPATVNIWLRVTDPGGLSDLSNLPDSAGTACPTGTPPRTAVMCQSMTP
jgi:prepilin-type N-terminal cleavage/methylation domain-containing protein